MGQSGSRPASVRRPRAGAEIPRATRARWCRPEKNDGDTAYRLTVKDVPVDGSWSISVYDEDRILREERARYVLREQRHRQAKRRPVGDGAVRWPVRRRRPTGSRSLPGWNYVVRSIAPTSRFSTAPGSSLRRCPCHRRHRHLWSANIASALCLPRISSAHQLRRASRRHSAPAFSREFQGNSATTPCPASISRICRHSWHLRG